MNEWGRGRRKPQTGLAEVPPSHPQPFTLWQRVQIAGLAWAGWMLLWLLGSTLRYQIEGWENFRSLKEGNQPIIYSFWHNQILYATHFWRFRNIAAITSQHFDGEAIARVIQRFGYVAPRGSSSRGAVRALLQLKRYLQQGGDVAFTVDGPRGPIYRVKSGPIWLSRKTAAPILPFHIEPKGFWSLRSWDRFRIPKPFTPTLIKIGEPFVVPPDGDEADWTARYQREMDSLSRCAEAHWEQRRSRHRR